MPPEAAAAADEDAGVDSPAADGGEPTARERPAPRDGGTPESPAAPFFSTVSVEDRASAERLGDGDLWANCWADDDAVYVAAGDSAGFGLPERADLVVARIEGRPGADEPLRGTTLSYGDAIGQIWSGPEYNRKPTGLLCTGGELYLAVQDLRLHTFSDAPAATILRSTDKGQSWSWDRERPMFRDYVFTTIMFLDFGRDAEHAPEEFVYAYGLDDNWSFDTTLTPPTQLYLARVPRGAIQDRTQWEFFTGYDSAGTPEWSSAIDARAPVLEDMRRTYTMPADPMRRFQNMTVINQGGVVYNAPLRRYIYTSWTEYTFEFYEAPAPWGPWTHFFTKDFGVTPWNDARNGGYATTIPSKFVSGDGGTMWLQANAWAATGADNYNFSLREIRVSPYAPSEPQNARSAEPLSRPSGSAVAIGRTFRLGRPDRLNDGVRFNQSEDSWSGNLSIEDYWGYTWPKRQWVNRVRYTTGRKTAEGGWFEELTVQIRRGSEWIEVDGLVIEPSYAGDSSVPDNATYTLRFDDAATDGVRIFGRPGGAGRFTSVAELSVLYE